MIWSQVQLFQKYFNWQKFQTDTLIKMKIKISDTNIKTKRSKTHSFVGLHKLSSLICHLMGEVYLNCLTPFDVNAHHEDIIDFDQWQREWVLKLPPVIKSCGSNHVIHTYYRRTSLICFTRDIYKSYPNIYLKLILLYVLKICILYIFTYMLYIVHCNS